MDSEISRARQEPEYGMRSSLCLSLLRTYRSSKLRVASVSPPVLAGCEYRRAKVAVHLLSHTVENLWMALIGLLQ